MHKILKISLVFLATCFLAFCLYFFAGHPKKAVQMTWGVDFSQMHAESLGLEWKKTYLAMFDDLGVKHVKLHTQWNWVQGQKNEFYFDDIDWQLAQAKSRNVDVIYVVGMKTGRWPECHIPDWAKNLSKEEQQQELLRYIQEVVVRYRNQSAISYWQVENEPLFRFGECPWYDKEFLKKEVQLVKSLDSGRLVIISDSGEQSTWIDAAKTGDVLGFTLYRKVWMDYIDGLGFYWTHVFTPMTYWRKVQMVEAIFNKKAIGVELQAEPWTVQSFLKTPLSEQDKTMNLQRFKDNILFAENTGVDTFYLWGAEWWYWLKEKQNRPDIWNEAKKIFHESR